MFVSSNPGSGGEIHIPLFGVKNEKKLHYKDKLKKMKQYELSPPYMGNHIENIIYH